MSWRRSIIMPVTWLLVTFQFVQTMSGSNLNWNSSQLLCSSMRYAYKSRGFNERDIPQQPISGTDLRFCPEGLTCCTESMEDKLSESARQQYELVVRETTATLHATFSSRAKKFDEFFRELLDKSKRDFHEMFKRTYGIIYEKNSVVFTDLFRDLEDYYSRGKLDLEEAMDHFFSTLYQRMFTVLNSQYRFDDKYLVCVSTHMKELKPFGDVPKKLSIQVKRSFVATRTFAQALSIARDVIAKIQTLGPSSECSHAVMRMSLCPACRGLPDLKPCSNLCVNVLKGCLAHHAQLASEWDNYIDALTKIADRLVGPFNIEQVVDPIDIKISDAIMNFQENGVEVTQKVFKGCGQPRLGKRSAPAGEIRFDTIKSTSQSRVSTAPPTTLERLVREIKQKVKSTKNFWTRLPQTICSHHTMADQTKLEGDCWNGTDRSRHGVAMVGENLGLPDSVTMETARPNSVVSEQIFNLRLITNKLENAYNGMDVEWDDEWSMSSGSGSGSGGGSDVPDEEDDDEDHDRTRKPDRNRPEPPDHKQDDIHEEDNDIEFSYGTNRNSDSKPTPPTSTAAGSPHASVAYLLPLVVVRFTSLFIIQ